VIDESEEQHEKQFEPRISTFRGITIDSSDEFENADDSIRINLNLIQMRLMKVIYN
jgi:hypothetical protein